MKPVTAHGRLGIAPLLHLALIMTSPAWAGSNAAVIAPGTDGHRVEIQRLHFDQAQCPPLGRAIAPTTPGPDLACATAEGKPGDSRAYRPIEPGGGDFFYQAPDSQRYSF